MAPARDDEVALQDDVEVIAGLAGVNAAAVFWAEVAMTIMKDPPPWRLEIEYSRLHKKRQELKKKIAQNTREIDRLKGAKKPSDQKTTGGRTTGQLITSLEKHTSELRRLRGQTDKEWKKVSGYFRAREHLWGEDVTPEKIVKFMFADLTDPPGGGPPRVRWSLSEIAREMYLHLHEDSEGHEQAPNVRMDEVTEADCKEFYPEVLAAEDDGFNDSVARLVADKINAELAEFRLEDDKRRIESARVQVGRSVERLEPYNDVFILEKAGGRIKSVRLSDSMIEIYRAKLKNNHKDLVGLVEMLNAAKPETEEDDK